VLISNFISSMKKWDHTLWDRLIKRSYLPLGRAGAWASVIWNACGFCYEFNWMDRGICIQCPLYEEFCLPTNIHRDYKNSLMYKISVCWENNNKEEFETLRQKMVDKMESCRHMFQVRSQKR